jgi:dienelactone hydrolase
MKKILLAIVVAITFVLPGCNDSGSENSDEKDSATASKDSTVMVVKQENVNINADTTTMFCYVAYDNSKPDKRPIVLVVPEWWGLNDYVRGRARQLAELGYFAVAVDMYGKGKMAETPDVAGATAGTFYKNPKLATGRLQAALDVAKSYPEADSSKVAAIGYCFGGSMVINAANLGMPLDGIVSFHGGLQVAPPSKNVKAKMLICNGAADPFVPEKDVANFKKQEDNAGVVYTFKNYPDAKHAFTNPEATEKGKKFNMPIAYNEQADKNSWSDMQAFFSDLWK